MKWQRSASENTNITYKDDYIKTKCTNSRKNPIPGRTQNKISAIPS